MPHAIHGRKLRFIGKREDAPGSSNFVVGNNNSAIVQWPVFHKNTFYQSARDNTYNGENDLSQDYVWEVYTEDEANEYALDYIRDNWIDYIGDNNNFTIRQGVTISGKNRIELYSNGDYNTLNLNQGYTTQGTVSVGDSNNHYLYLNLSGNNNTVTKQQTGTSSFNETTINGNTNNLTNIQQGNSNKVLFQNINGNNNTVTTNQKDTGQHYLDINLTGNGHSVNAIQEGSGSHAATINFTNSGGASSLNLNQSGSINQTYSIQQSCTNPAGCSTTISQP
jgi:hypothetical protein